MKKKIKLWKWSVSFGIISLITLIVFIMALRALLWQYFNDYATWIALISGSLLVIFISLGTLQINQIMSKGKKMFS